MNINNGDDIQNLCYVILNYLKNNNINDIDDIIDFLLSFLYENGIYNYNNIDERNRLFNKANKIKEIAKFDDEYKNKTKEEKINLVFGMFKDILNKKISSKQNADILHKSYSLNNGDISDGKTLLEKESITTGEKLEISYCTIGSGSLHLHCGISRKIDYIDNNGKLITHFHSLLKKLKNYISSRYGTMDKYEIEKICNDLVIRPYIIMTLENALKICNNYDNLKTIRLDTNDGFFKIISPTLMELGFIKLDENDKFHMKELASEFPIYKFPDELDKFYLDYPDRKNSVTIHTIELEKNLKNLKNENKSDEIFNKFR